MVSEMQYLQKWITNKIKTAAAKLQCPPLTNFIKSSILDVWQGSEYASATPNQSLFTLDTSNICSNIYISNIYSFHKNLLRYI